MNKQIPLLVIGAGSIGERHIRNLWRAGYQNITVFRQRNLPFRDIGNAEVKVITDRFQLMQQEFFAAFICTPTAQHVHQAFQCLRNNVHLFCEKPLSHQVSGIEDLLEMTVQSMQYFHMGYMLHHHPFLKQIKDFSFSGVYGPLQSAETWWFSYLPDWHPWENYQESYAAKKELGGGATLTLCHDIELLIWICGPVADHETVFSYCADLGLDVDSGSEVIVQYQSGVTSKHHISFCSKEEKRIYIFQFELATITIDYLKKKMTILHNGSTEAHTLPDFDRNQMYMEEVKAFFTTIEANHFDAQANIATIKKEMDLIQICTQSHSASRLTNSKN